MLRDYEILYIARPELDEAQLEVAVRGVNQLIEGLGGVPTKTDIWGRRRLAYEVRHLREGHYILQLFELDPGAVPELESQLRISETVFRHLIVRRPEVAAAGPAPDQRDQEPAASAEVAAVTAVTEDGEDSGEE